MAAWGEAQGLGAGAGAPAFARARVSDQIIREIQRSIAEGKLPRGGRLPTERELAAQFGVSAPTIREAIRALSAMGLIEVRHGSGAYVAESSRGLLDSSLAALVQWERVGARDLLGLLRNLHLYAGSIAATAATDDDIKKVVAVAERTATLTGKTELLSSFFDYLTSFVAAAHQPLLDALCGYLTSVLVDLHLRFHPDHSNEYWERWAAGSAEQRVAVARALESRDPAEIHDAISAFYDRITERLLALPGLADAHVL